MKKYFFETKEEAEDKLAELGEGYDVNRLKTPLAWNIWAVVHKEDLAKEMERIGWEMGEKDGKQVWVYNK